MDQVDIKALDRAIEKYGAQKEALLSIMHEIQKEQGSISEASARYVSEKLAVPLSQVFGAASFYRAFSLQQRGKHHIKVCVGTSCYLRNSEKLFDRIGRELQLSGEGTTGDLEFSVEKVRCMGCCNAGPTITIDEQIYESVSVDTIPDLPRQEIYGDITHSKAMNIIKKYREEK